MEVGSEVARAEDVAEDAPSMEGLGNRDGEGMEVIEPPPPKAKGEIELSADAVKVRGAEEEAEGEEDRVGKPGVDVSVDTNERLLESETNEEGVEPPVKVGGKGEAVPPLPVVGVLPPPPNPPQGVPVNKGGDGEGDEEGLPPPPIEVGVPPEESVELGVVKEVDEIVEEEVMEGVPEALPTVFVGGTV